MLETIIQGGPLMIPLMIESILALALLIDRWWAFRVNASIDSRALRAKVLAFLAQDQIAEAAQLCANTPGPVSAVLLAGLQAYEKHQALSSRPELLRVLISDAMNDYAVTAMGSVEKGLNILSFVGNSAPLFGMTGTVTGMISAFGAMADAGAVNASVVAAGISEALITTAAGLLIAMAAVIPFHFFTAKANAIDGEITESISEVLDFVMLRPVEAQAVLQEQR